MKDKLKIFKKILIEKNQSLNLFSRKDPKNQLELLIQQGLSAGRILKPVFKNFKAPILDVGSGNGFPGLLFAILFPQNFFCLCDKSRKKIEFLKYTLSQTETKNAELFCGPAENIKKNFGMILSQAALPIKKAQKLLEKKLSPKGQAFLWQGPNWKNAWKKSAILLPTEFKSYKIKGSTKILLKVKKVSCL